MLNYKLLALLLMNFVCFSQNISNDYISIQEQLISLNADGKLDVSSISGSSYLNEEFQLGRIVIENQMNQSVFLRYNTLKDVVEIKAKIGQDEIFILPRSQKYTYELENHTLALENYITMEGEVLNGYVMKYYDKGNVLFFQKAAAKIKPRVIAETSYDKNMPAKINIQTRYFLGLNGDPVIGVKLKRRVFKRIFKSPEMKNYLSKHKIKDVNDVVNMLEFYNK